MSNEKSFEDLYRELEDTVRKLESGDLPLAESLTLFEAARSWPNSATPCWMAPNSASANLAPVLTAAWTRCRSRAGKTDDTNTSRRRCMTWCITGPCGCR